MGSVLRRLAGQPLLFGQIGFALGLLACFAIKPQFLRSEGGFSNYGVTAATIPFFTFAFLSAAIGTFVAAQRIVGRSWLKWSLRILAALFFLVLASTYPYKLNSFYDILHQDVSIALLVYGIGLGAWLVIKRHDWQNIVLFGVQFGASVTAYVTFLGFIHLLFVSQFVAGLAFSALLVRATSQLLREQS